MKRTSFNLIGRLLMLIQPLLFFMFIAVLMGVAGFLCAIFITIFGGFALVKTLAFEVSLPVSTIFIIIGSFALLRGILRYAEQASNHYIAFRLLALIRDHVFQALRRLAPAKLAGKDKGNLISLITSDIEQLEVFYAHTISPVVIAIIVSLVMVCFIGSFHPLLGTIAVLAYVSIGCILPILAARAGTKSGAAYRQEVGDVNSYILSSLRGLRESIQFADGAHRIEQIQAKSTYISTLQGAMRKQEGITYAMTNTGILVFSLLMLFAGIFLLHENIIRYDGVLLSFLAMISSFGPVVALSNLSNNLTQTFACANRVFDILDEAPQTQDITTGETVDFHGASCQNVSFSYNKTPVLQHVNAILPKGKIIGVVGKSGSGKSTLLRLLMRFWNVQDGQIQISNKQIDQINTVSLRDMQGYVTQETELFSDTIENNIKIARLHATQEEVIVACKKASIHAFISTLPNGYQTKITELGSSLSHGECQRIGIARAFLHDAPFLLLDEPTSNIDSLNESIILKSLKEACTEKTVLLVSHRKSTMGIADIVYTAQDGWISG